MPFDDVSVVPLAFDFESGVFVLESLSISFVLFFTFFVLVVERVQMLDGWLLGDVLHSVEWDGRCLVGDLEKSLGNRYFG
jgi:hypothetical protein